MNIIESIKPQQKLFVMDLVNEAGIDVSDWANFKGGAKKARSNPKYCYDWAFVGTDVVVLNIWYGSIIEESNTILLRSNLRETSRSDSTKAVWKNRADKFDKIVLNAYQRNQSVRLIINEGYRREGNFKTEKASVVKFRLLDPIPWSVTFYDYASGQFVLTRGIQQPKLVDQFDIDPEIQVPAEKHKVSADVFNRSPEVRRIVLQRANGKCEFCGENGFKTSSGFLFLETHHIIPLSQNGPDTIHNVAAICPNHHREAHYGQNAGIIREALTKRITESTYINLR
jgi:5-methylcytosine-specific restriction protein A